MGGGVQGWKYCRRLTQSQEVALTVWEVLHHHSFCKEGLWAF